MNQESTPLDPSPPADSPPLWLRWARWTEDLLLGLSLGILVTIPIVEIVLRSAFHTGLTAGTTFVQHMTLFVGMLGGAVAARQGRLLSLASASGFLQGKTRALATVLAHSVAAAISGCLAFASIQLVQQEIAGGKIIAYGIPAWSLQLVMPIGFILITWRLVWHAAKHWPGRCLAGGIAAVLVAAAAFFAGDGSPVGPERLILPAFGLLLAATAAGAPIFATLGGAALILFWGEGRPIASISLNHYSLVTDPTLPTIPLFTLAGYFLAEGGASRRLVHLFDAWLGRVRGGAAVVCVLVCAFFTSFTGASGVTILALGGLLMPVLEAARYRSRDALGLLTSSGSVGLLFAPCLPLILYAIIAQNAITLGGFDLDVEGGLPEVTMQQMFLAGILPGLLLVAITIAWGIWLARKGDPATTVQKTPFELRNAFAALWQAKWELLLPVVALGSLFSGWATAVEAAALTAAYALFTQTVVHRDLSIRKDLLRVITECGLLVGGVLLILGVAMGLTKFLIFEDVPYLALEWVQQHIDSKLLFLLCLNLMLLAVGCLMDIFSAIVVIVPLIIPVGLAFGMDPVHLGIIFLANLELGYLTPPVGLNLFLASYRFHQPLPVVYHSILPILGLRFLGVLVITYLPWLSTFLPQLIRN